MSAFAGVVPMLIVFPLGFWISSQFFAIQKKILAAADMRIETTNEVIINIRIIKYFAWEHRFNSKIEETRKKELTHLRNLYILWAMNNLVFSSIPFLINLGKNNYSLSPLTNAQTHSILSIKISANPSYSCVPVVHITRKETPAPIGRFHLHYTISIVEFATPDARRTDNVLSQLQRYADIPGDLFPDLVDFWVETLKWFLCCL